MFTALATLCDLCGLGGEIFGLSRCPGNLVRCDLSHLFDRAGRPGSPRYPILPMLVVYPN